MNVPQRQECPCPRVLARTPTWSRHQGDIRTPPGSQPVPDETGLGRRRGKEEDRMRTESTEELRTGQWEYDSTNPLLRLETSGPEVVLLLGERKSKDTRVEPAPKVRTGTTIPPGVGSEDGGRLSPSSLRLGHRTHPAPILLSGPPVVTHRTTGLAPADCSLCETSEGHRGKEGV